MIGIVTVGLICRLAPTGLEPWARKWSGSVLWGALFWCIAALVTSPERRVMRFLVGALGVAASEWLKMVHLGHSMPCAKLRQVAFFSAASSAGAISAPMSSV
ncbi:hypothetical protein ABHV46_01975 [Asaia sp. BMEF1]|uniref:hypothetical protein n=1 Tax=Asaia sp. BMEF1 TaxID=3155932 RepID=UPI003F669345